MAAVGRRPCGFQGQGGPPPPALLQGFSASLVATCPSWPPQAARALFFFFLGKVGWGAPETDKIWKKGSVCGGAEGWNRSRGSQVNECPLPSHPGPTSPRGAQPDHENPQAKSQT